MLLRHGSMRPVRGATPPPTRLSPSLEDHNTRLATRNPIVRGRERDRQRDDDDSIRQPNVSDNEEDDGAEPDDADSELLTRGLKPLRRGISKNCATIKRFGDRLYIRRRQRHAQRIVIDDVERMRERLVAMDRQLSLLDSITVNMRQTAMGVAMDTITTYFHHMKHGLNPSDVEYDRDVTVPFLHAVMTPDVKCQDFSGLDSFFKQWEYVTKYHAQVTMLNDYLLPLPAECDARGDDVYVIKATGTTTCRISRDTLVHFFPHILQDEELVQWLIDKEYGYGYTMILHFNSRGRVFQFESRIDLTSGLLSLLNDPRVTLKLIDSSMWTKSGNLRGEVHEGQIPIENGFLA